MHPVSKLGTGAAAMLAAATLVAVGLVPASAPRAERLKHYESQQKQFWTHPPDDWFMGDETAAQKGTHVLNTVPPPTGFTDDEIEATLKQIKLPPGFKIELWASGLPGARQMAWGEKGTLFVGLVRYRQRLCCRGRGRQTPSRPFKGMVCRPASHTATARST